MAFTQTQYDALVNAIAQGVLTVEYADKKVTYRSLADMMALKNTMANELGLNGNNSSTNGRKFADFSKGL